jgi:hypothetical protein
MLTPGAVGDNLLVLTANPNGAGNGDVYRFRTLTQLDLEGNLRGPQGLQGIQGAPGIDGEVTRAELNGAPAWQNFTLDNPWIPTTPIMIAIHRGFVRMRGYAQLMNWGTGNMRMGTLPVSMRPSDPVVCGLAALLTGSFHPNSVMLHVLFQPTGDVLLYSTANEFAGVVGLNYIMFDAVSFPPALSSDQIGPDMPVTLSAVP